MNKEPLSCELENNQLVIRIGIEILTFAFQTMPELIGGDGESSIQVVDPLIFAKDVKKEIERDDSSDDPLICIMLDKAMLNAYKNGSLGVKEK